MAKTKKQIVYVATDKNTEASLHFIANDGEMQLQLEQITQRGKWVVRAVRELTDDEVKANIRSIKKKECKCGDKKGCCSNKEVNE